MSKLYDRDHTRGVVQDLPGTYEGLPEVPDDVRIPDDLSGLHHFEDQRSARGIRWMRWVSAVVLLAASAAAIVFILQSDDTTQTDVRDTTTPWSIGEGPGSNSLAPSDVPVPWTTPLEGPGSTSLSP